MAARTIEQGLLVDEKPVRSSGRTTFKDKLINVLPIVDWLPEYRAREELPQDISCGITLGCVLISQSLAHAKLCGVSVIHGPYSCIFPPLVYAFFGTCHEASVGTGGLVALLVGKALEVYDTEAERTEKGAILSVVVGVFLTIMGIGKMAFMVRFLSRPALSGFITASAIMIILSMAGGMLGMPAEYSGKRFISGVVFDPLNLKFLNVPTTVMSLVAFAWFETCKKLKKTSLAKTSLKWVLMFKELIGLAVGSVVCIFFAESAGIELIGHVDSGIPTPTFPITSTQSLSEAQDMLANGALIAVVVFISSWGSAKKCALKNHYHVTAFNELVALGLANVSSAFLGGVPTQIGLSRSALAMTLGVKSQVGAGMVVAAVLSLIVKFGAPLIYYVPGGILNTIIIFAAQELFEFEQPRSLFKFKEYKDCACWIVGFVATLMFGCVKGITIAVVVSMVLVMYSVVEPNISILAERPDDKQWVKREMHPEAAERKGMLVLRVEGPMFYANMESLQEQINLMELEAANRDQPVTLIILSAASISFIDSTALQVLEEMIGAWKGRGIQFYIANAFGDCKELIETVLKDALLKDDDVSAPIGALADKQKPVETMERKYRRASARAMPQMIDMTSSDSAAALQASNMRGSEQF